jgi:transposase
MQIHGRAKLGPGGRLALCEAINGGMTFRQAAAAMSVSPATAHRWWHRYACASPLERQSLAWAADRSSRPVRSPRLLDAGAQERICEARRRTGWGPRLLAGITGHPHSTVWKVLHRHGLSRRPREPREQANRYEWPCPGDLLHIDIKTYSRFEKPGHAVTGDRARVGRHQRKHLGQDYAHAAVDDHSRLAFSELYPDERAASVVVFMETRPRVLPKPRDHDQTDPHRQRLELHPQPSTRRTARPRRHPAQDDPPLQSTHQRQGGALPSDDGTRVGIRTDLRQLKPPRPRPATLAPALQHAQTTLRHREPATHQPRSQPT